MIKYLHFSGSFMHKVLVRFGKKLDFLWRKSYCHSFLEFESCFIISSQFVWFCDGLCTAQCTYYILPLRFLAQMFSARFKHLDGTLRFSIETSCILLLLSIKIPRAPNSQIYAVLWNRNRNRRNRNFLQCGTGTGTVTCKKVGKGTVINYGSGTVIKWYHKSSHKHTA